MASQSNIVAKKWTTSTIYENGKACVTRPAASVLKCIATDNDRLHQGQGHKLPIAIEMTNYFQIELGEYAK